MKKLGFLFFLVFSVSLIASENFKITDAEDSLAVRSGGTDFYILKNPRTQWGANGIFSLEKDFVNSTLSFIVRAPGEKEKQTSARSLMLLNTGKADIKILADTEETKILVAEYPFAEYKKNDENYPDLKLRLKATFQKDLPAAFIEAVLVSKSDNLTLEAFNAVLNRDFENYQTEGGTKTVYKPGTWSPFPKTEYIILEKAGKSFLFAADKNRGKTMTPFRSVALLSNLNQYHFERLGNGESKSLKLLLGTTDSQTQTDNELAFFRIHDKKTNSDNLNKISSKDSLMPMHMKKAPLIDGSLNEWTSEPQKRGGGHDRPLDTFTWKGERDLSLKVWTAFDKDFLYIACRVNDDYFEQTNSGANIWAGDMLQIAFDPLREKTVTDNFIDIGFSASNPSVAWCWQHPVKSYIGNIGEEIKFKTSRDKEGASYEIAIPWKFLKPFDLRKGSIGFSLAALDADGNGIENWMGLTEGVAGGKNPEFYYNLMLGSREELIAANIGYSSPSIFFASETLLPDESNVFSSMVLMKKEGLPAKIQVKLSSGKTSKIFTEDLKPGINNINFELPANSMEPGKCDVSVSLLSGDKKVSEKKMSLDLINEEYLIKQAEKAEKKYDILIKKYDEIKPEYGKDLYLESDLEMAEYFIPFVRKEATRKTVLREKTLRCKKGKEEIPMDSNYKIFVYSRANKNISYINSMLEKGIQKADRILEGKEKILTVPEIKKGIKPKIVDGNFEIDGQKVFFMGPNTWTAHYTEIKGFARSGFNFMDINPVRGNKIIYKDEPFYIPPKSLPFNGNTLKEAEKYGVYYFGRVWEGNKRLNDELYNKLSKKLEKKSDAVKYVDFLPNLVYFVIYGERNHKEKDKKKANASFREWLLKKYGNVSAFDSESGCKLASFDDVSIKKAAGNGALKYEFFLFESGYQLKMFKLFRDLKRKYLKSPFSVHFSTLNLYAYDPLMESADYEEMWKYLDIIGWDGGIGPNDRNFAMRWSDNEILHCDIANSFYPEKPVANNEAHNIPGKYGADVRSSFIYSALFQPYVHGRDAAVLWVWDICQHSQWGNHIFTRANTHHAAARAALDLRRLADFVAPFQKSESPFAILYSLPSMAEKGYVKNMIGVYEGLFFSGFPVRFISERQIKAGKLKNYKLIVVPNARRVDNETFRKLVAFSKSSGKVVLVGKDSLSLNELGKEIAERKKEIGQMASIELVAPQKYFQSFSKILDEMNLFPANIVQTPNGEHVWSVESRSARTANNEQLLFILNLAKEPKEIKIKGDGEWFDLISNRKVNSLMTLKPLDIYLLIRK